MANLASRQTTPEKMQRELLAMEEVGRLRSRAIGRVFFVTWIVGTGIIVATRALGMVGAASLSAVIGGALAKSYVSSKTGEFIAAASKKYGVPPEALDRTKYIIE